MLEFVAGRFQFSAMGGSGEDTVKPYPLLEDLATEGTGHLLARKRWILREADFTFGPLHKRGGYARGTRSANHTGCPDGGDGFRSHSPDGPTARIGIGLR